MFLANWRGAPGGLLQEGHYDNRTQCCWPGCNPQDPSYMWVIFFQKCLLYCTTTAIVCLFIFKLVVDKDFYLETVSSLPLLIWTDSFPSVANSLYRTFRPFLTSQKRDLSGSLSIFVCWIWISLFSSFIVEAVAALGNKVVETLRTQDPTEGNTVWALHILRGLRKVEFKNCILEAHHDNLTEDLIHLILC